MTTRKTRRWIELLAGLLLGAGTLAGAGQPPYGQGYDPARDPFADGSAAIALAAQTGRHVLIQLGGDWCSWCHLLDRTLHRQADLAALLDAGFVVLKVNVSDENDNADFLKGLPAFDGYPHIFVANGAGEIVHSQDVSAWLLKGRYSPEKIKDFLLQWQPPASVQTHRL